MVLPSDFCEWCSRVGLEDEGDSCPCLSAYGFYLPGALIPAHCFVPHGFHSPYLPPLWKLMFPWVPHPAEGNVEKH